jgi:type III restriction enzyme
MGNSQQVVIENPVINSPYHEPERHFRFTDEGITAEVDDGRRPSSYFVPIAKPRKKGQKQLEFDTEWTKDRIEENKLVNQIRARVAIWRKGGYPGVTATTKQLLEYWTDPERERKLFFCQIEALETAIYITEAARSTAMHGSRINCAMRTIPPTPACRASRFKMATGAGKTVVMAMIIAWHALNKLANPQDARFSDTFLIVTPGITIRDRLRVLLPNDPRTTTASGTSSPAADQRTRPGEDSHHELPRLPVAREVRRRQAHASSSPARPKPAFTENRRTDGPPRLP